MTKWLALLFVALLARVAHAEPPPPLEAYGKLPAIETIAISPDGKRLAYIVTDGEVRTAAVSEIATKTQLVRVPAGNRKVVSVQWAGSEHVILTVEHDTYIAGLSGGKQAWTVAADVDLLQHRIHPLIDIDQHDTSRNGINLNVVYGRPQIRTVNGRTLVYVQGIHFDGNRGLPALFKYDPSTSNSSVFQPGNGRTRGWLIGQDGQPLSEEDYDQSAQTWTVHNRSSGGLGPKVSVPASIERPYIAGFGRDGNSTLIGLPNTANDSGEQLVELAPGHTTWGAPILDHEFNNLVFDPQTEALIGTGVQQGEGWTYSFFDPNDQKRWNGLAKAYPNAVVKLDSLSADHQRWIVSVDSPSEGPAFAMVDFATGKAQWLGYNYEAASADLAEKRPIAFRAGDGLELTGYLTIPKGAEAKKLPLIVFPHGGPAARDQPGFDWWAQAMASRGYAVLQVEFRGSEGYGWKHLSAGFGQWGRKMQTDLSDGVRYLAGKDVIDPKRVCIVGASYGGYAALAGATLGTGPYRCAVSVSGISDVRRLVRWADERDGPASERYLVRFLGVDKLGDPKLDEISPLRHVNEVKIPILLIHGKDDTVVDFSQSQLMYDALKRAGKDVQLVTLPHEDHWLLTGATRLQMLQATMDFLQKNNPPG